MSNNTTSTSITVANSNLKSAPENNPVASTDIPTGPVTRSDNSSESVGTLNGSDPMRSDTVSLMLSRFFSRISVSVFFFKEKRLYEKSFHLLKPILEEQAMEFHEAAVKKDCCVNGLSVSFLERYWIRSKSVLCQSTFPMPCKQGRYSRGIWKLFFNKFISYDGR